MIPFALVLLAVAGLFHIAGAPGSMIGGLCYYTYTVSLCGNPQWFAYAAFALGFCGLLMRLDFM